MVLGNLCTGSSHWRCRTGSGLGAKCLSLSLPELLETTLHYTTVSLGLRLFSPLSHSHLLSLQPRRHDQVPGRSLLVGGWRNYSDETKPTAQKKPANLPCARLTAQAMGDVNSRFCAVLQNYSTNAQLRRGTHLLATMLHAER